MPNQMTWTSCVEAASRIRRTRLRYSASHSGEANFRYFYPSGNPKGRWGLRIQPKRGCRVLFAKFVRWFSASRRNWVGQTGTLFAEVDRLYAIFLLEVFLYERCNALHQRVAGKENFIAFFQHDLCCRLISLIAWLAGCGIRIVSYIGSSRVFLIV